ncbi:IS3 family transposase [Empedobacter tilapiae]
MRAPKKSTPETYLKDIRRKTRRIFTAEQKILIVMEALRAETSVAELCRKHGIQESTFYKWNKEFIEAGKKRLSGDTTREATSDEVAQLREENRRLKESVADLVIRYDINKKKFGNSGIVYKYRKYMRLSGEEKLEIINIVTRSEIGVNKTLRELGIHKSTFYKWYHLYQEKGEAGFFFSPNSSRRQWNSIPEEEQKLVIDVALEAPELSSRELAHKITDEQGIFISESSVYRILKKSGLVTAPSHILISAANEFKDKTSFVHEMWQTDFTYFKIVGWGWYYLSTVIDDFSRYIVHWELCKTMKAQDVQRTVDRAIIKAGLKKGQVPKLLSDNGSCYVAGEIKTYLEEEYKMKQIHGRPAHPQTQGKIERYHRTMKNVVKLHHYYSPEELIKALEEFVNRYNNERYHESLQNLTPADVYYGRTDEILKIRQQIKQETIIRRKQYYEQNKSVFSSN